MHEIDRIYAEYLKTSEEILLLNIRIIGLHKSRKKLYSLMLGLDYKDPKHVRLRDRCVANKTKCYKLYKILISLIKKKKKLSIELLDNY